MLFRARQFEFRFPRPTIVMGIVNVTPDSFSDGGKFFSAEAAVAHALELAAQGAEILDLGGESTRPGAEPVIEALAAQTRVALSIDTMKPAVARAALAAGASLVNDVAAGLRGPALAGAATSETMWNIVAEFGAGYVCMHAQGSPQTMQQHPAYADVVREVANFFSERLNALSRAGVAAEQVVFDPGIGFGKTPEHNLQLLAAMQSFKKWQRPLLLGVSRKSFIEKLTGAKLNERLPASLACATLAVESGVNILRAHDVAETVQAVRMAEAILQHAIVD